MALGVGLLPCAAQETTPQTPLPQAADSPFVPLVLLVLQRPAETKVKKDDLNILLLSALRDTLRESNQYRVSTYSPNLPSVRRALLERLLNASDLIEPMKQETLQNVGRVLGVRYVFSFLATMEKDGMKTSALLQESVSQHEWRSLIAEDITIPATANRKRLKREDMVNLTVDTLALRFGITSHRASDATMSASLKAIEKRSAKATDSPEKTAANTPEKTAAAVTPDTTSPESAASPMPSPAEIAKEEKARRAQEKKEHDAQVRAEQQAKKDREREQKAAADKAKRDVAALPKQNNNPSTLPDSNGPSGKTPDSQPNPATAPTRANTKNGVTTKPSNAATKTDTQTAPPNLDLPPISENLSRPAPLTIAPPVVTTDNEALATRYRQQGDLANVIASLRRAINERPRDMALRHQLIQAYQDRHLFDMALAETARARQLNPDDASLHRLYGDALLAKGDAAGAMKEYREATRLDPGNIAAQVALGDALLADNQFGEAMSAYMTAAKTDEKSPLPHRRLARAFLNGAASDSARYADCLEQIKQARALIAATDTETYLDDYATIARLMEARLNDLLDELQNTYQAAISGKKSANELTRATSDMRLRAEAAADFLDKLPPGAGQDVTNAQYQQAAGFLLQALSLFREYLAKNESHTEDAMNGARADARRSLNAASKRLSTVKPRPEKSPELSNVAGR